MVIAFAFLAALNAGALCVARTDVCAPAGSTLDGTIGPSGGQVTITPTRPMKALGAELKAGSKVVVTVLPWSSSDGTTGAIVHVTGELDHEAQLSGARVGGTVRIGQLQRSKGGSPPAQLVEATDFKGGKLRLGNAGTVDVGPGMRLQGSVDIDRVRLEITSPQPIHALGLDLEAGTVRLEQRPTGYTIGGMLVRPQEVGGVLVEKQVYATVENGKPTLGSATLARATPLQLLGLPDGEAPAGTVVRAAPGNTLLVGPGPFTVCGLALAPVATLNPPSVMFTPSARPAHVAVTAALAGRDVDVGGGLRLQGPVTLRYAPGGCQRVGLDATLARPTVERGLHFAAGTALMLGEAAGEPIVRGTLARPEVVDGVTWTGAIMVRVAAGGELHVLDGTLAQAGPFEEWQLPAGSHVQRFGTGWSFTTPRGQAARARGAHRGELVDGVTQADSDDRQTTFTLQRPHTVRGTSLAFASLGIEHATGCVLGDVATAQRAGIFRIPTGGNATVCNGTVIAAEGTYAVPSLQVGSWFATRAIAGVLGSDPPASDLEGMAPPPPPRHAKPSATAPAGYWIQINSLCQGASGIPQPPPPERWIWVDRKGQAAGPADQKELAARAAKRGTACPVTPCCPP